MSISLGLLIDALKASAIASALVPSEESVYRDLCRRYSVKFHTPLPTVLTLEAEHVIMNVFEQQLSDTDIDEHLETLLEQIYRIEDPTYDAQAEREIREFAKRAEEEEKRRLAEGRKIWEKQTKGRALEAQTPPELPKQGVVNFAYLDENNER